MTRTCRLLLDDGFRHQPGPGCISRSKKPKRLHQEKGEDQDDEENQHQTPYELVEYVEYLECHLKLS